MYQTIKMRKALCDALRAAEAKEENACTARSGSRVGIASPLPGFSLKHKANDWLAAGLGAGVQKRQ